MLKRKIVNCQENKLFFSVNKGTTVYSFIIEMVLIEGHFQNLMKCHLA